MQKGRRKKRKTFTAQEQAQRDRASQNYYDNVAAMSSHIDRSERELAERIRNAQLEADASELDSLLEEIDESPFEDSDSHQMGPTDTFERQNTWTEDEVHTIMQKVVYDHKPVPPGNLRLVSITHVLFTEYENFKRVITTLGTWDKISQHDMQLILQLLKISQPIDSSTVILTSQRHNATVPVMLETGVTNIHADIVNVVIKTQDHYRFAIKLIGKLADDTTSLLYNTARRNMFPRPPSPPPPPPPPPPQGQTAQTHLYAAPGRSLLF